MTVDSRRNQSTCKDSKGNGAKPPSQQCNEDDSQRSEIDFPGQHCAGNVNPGSAIDSRRLNQTNDRKGIDIKPPSLQCIEKDRERSEIETSRQQCAGTENPISIIDNRGNQSNDRKGNGVRPPSPQCNDDDRDSNEIKISRQQCVGNGIPRLTTDSTRNQSKDIGVESPCQQCNYEDSQTRETESSSQNCSGKRKLQSTNSNRRYQYKDTQRSGNDSPSQQGDGRENPQPASDERKINPEKPHQTVGKSIPLKESKGKNTPGKQRSGKGSSSQSCSGIGKMRFTNSNRSNQNKDTEMSGNKSPSQPGDGRDNPQPNSDKRKNPNNDKKNNVDHKLRCLYTNADDLMNKRNELLASIEVNHPDIIAITEVLPKYNGNRIQIAEFEIEGYDCFTNGSDGRGVCLWTKKGLKATKNDELTDSVFKESVWCEISLHDKDNLLIGCVYRSPNGTKENNIQLLTLINKACERKDSHLLIVGDFNYGEIDWEAWTSRASESHDSSKLVNCLQDNYLHQEVRCNTRYREGQKPSLLDLIICE